MKILKLALSCAAVQCTDRCVVPVFQGCDELGDHAGGPSEKDHEQHTDYESPDAPSPRHRRPGVTGTGHHHLSTGVKMKSKTDLEQRLGRNRDNG